MDFKLRIFYLLMDDRDWVEFITEKIKEVDIEVECRKEK